MYLHNNLEISERTVIFSNRLILMGRFLKGMNILCVVPEEKRNLSKKSFSKQQYVLRRDRYVCVYTFVYIYNIYMHRIFCMCTFS